MPALSLSCRVCATEHPLEATGSVQPLLRPARPASTTGTRCARRSRASGSRRARSRSGATPTCCPSPRPRSRGSRPGSRRSFRRRGSPRSSAIGELWLKLDTANPTHSFKDRVVAVAARKAQELGLDDALVLVDREPRRRGRGARRSRGARGGRLRPGRPRAGEARGGRRRTARRSTRSTALRPLLAALGRALVRAAVGLRQRQPPLVLRRGLEDARVRDRRAARLADARRRRDPDRLGRALPQGRPGLLASCARSASSTAPAPRSSAARRRAASRSRPRSARARRSKPVRPDSIARSLAIGNPADGDFAVATARETGGAIHAVAEEADRREHGAPARGRRASSARRRPASRSARSARRSRPARSGRATASSCSSPATG